MTELHDAADLLVFKPRSSRWFAGITWLLAALGIVGAVAANGAAGLQLAWPMLAVAYLGWWVFWFPAVMVDDDAVALRNVLRTIKVPWAALIHVDTKYSLTLVTPQGSYSAWAAPAPGIVGSHRGKPEHVQGLPLTTYGPGESVRPGDLRNSDSGAAALLVRSRWGALAEAGRIELGVTGTTPVLHRTHRALIAVGTGLLLAGAAALIVS